MWQNSLRIDYKPNIEIKTIAEQGDRLIHIFPDLVEYCVKENTLETDREWFIELTRQMQKTKAITTGGIFRKYLSELEKEGDIF